LMKQMRMIVSVMGEKLLVEMTITCWTTFNTKNCRDQSPTCNSSSWYICLLFIQALITFTKWISIHSFLLKVMLIFLKIQEYRVRKCSLHIIATSTAASYWCVGKSLYTDTVWFQGMPSRNHFQLLPESLLRWQQMPVLGNPDMTSEPR
jgi:hypothetical protein